MTPPNREELDDRECLSGPQGGGSSYKRLIQTATAQCKPLGYRKCRDFLYTKNKEGNLGFIWFLTDKWRNPDEHTTCFTVEVCVASQKLLERFRGVYHFGSAKQSIPQENHYSARLGYLMDYRNDHWWNINPSNEVAVTREILEAIHQFAIPEIQREITDGAISTRALMCFEQGFRTNIAVLNNLVYLLHESGDATNFKRVAAFVYQTYGSRPFGPNKNVAQFLEELGFDPRDLGS